MGFGESLFGRRGFVATALVVLIAVAGVGCSPVLTSQDVDAVGRFADAAKSYGTLPGAAIKAYEQAREDRIVLQAAATDVPLVGATSPAAEAAFDKMKQEVQTDRRLLTLADQADLQLKVLETYATLLQDLTSDKPFDELDKSATSLSGSIDKAIGEYNALYRQGKPAVPSIGSTVAEGVRGIAGVFIRYRQRVLLKGYVIKAEPIVKDITEDVKELMDPFVAAGGGSYIDGEYSALHNAAGGLPAGAKRLTLEQARLLNDAVDKVVTCETLATSAIKAADSYRDAHAKLVEAVNHKAKLEDVLASIATLREQVSAARELKKKIDADNAKKSS